MNECSYCTIKTLTFLFLFSFVSQQPEDYFLRQFYSHNTDTDTF